MRYLCYWYLHGNQSQSQVNATHHQKSEHLKRLLHLISVHPWMCSPLSTDHTENLRALYPYIKHLIQVSKLDDTNILLFILFGAHFSSVHSYPVWSWYVWPHIYTSICLSINLHSIQHFHIYTAAQCLTGRSEAPAQTHTSIDVVGRKELGAWNPNILFFVPVISTMYQHILLTA